MNLDEDIEDAVNRFTATEEMTMAAIITMPLTKQRRILTSIRNLEKCKLEYIKLYWVRESITYCNKSIDYFIQVD